MCRQSEVVVNSSLSNETVSDKAVRFGCGAVIGVAILVSLVIYGVVEDERGLVVGGIAVLGCGILAALGGDRAVGALLKVLKWTQ